MSGYSWTFFEVSRYLQHARAIQSSLVFETARETYIIDDIQDDSGKYRMLYRWWSRKDPKRITLDSMMREGGGVFLMGAEIKFEPYQRTGDPKLVWRTEGKKEFMHIEEAS